MYNCCEGRGMRGEGEVDKRGGGGGRGGEGGGGGGEER